MNEEPLQSTGRDLIKEDINQIIDQVISQNLLIDSDENLNLNDNQLFHCNKPVKRKSNLKKSKFISPSRKFVLGSPTKLNKNRSLSSLFKRSPSKSNLSRSNLNKPHLAKSNKSDQCKHPKSAKLKRSSKATGDQLNADKDENVKEPNYKDKFKKQRLNLEDELDDKLLNKLKDVEKGLLNEAAFNLKSNKAKKPCKEKASLSSEQAVTNVFNKSTPPDSQINKASTGDFLNQHFNCFRQLDAKLISDHSEFPKFYDNPLDELDLKKSSGFIDDQLLDEQLNEKLDLDNLISSLIDKLDSSSELNDLNRDAHFDSPADNQNSNQASNQLSNDPAFPSSLNRQPAPNSATMVSNKNLALNSVNDKHLLNSFGKSSKTNGLSNGHSEGHSNGKIKLESHFNSSSSSSSSTFSSSKSKKSKKDVNSKPSKAKSKVSSLYDFHFDSDSDDRQSETDLFSLVTDHSSSSTDHSSSSTSSSASSSNAHKSTNGSKKQQGTNKSSKLFTIQNCIKSEIRKKLLEKSKKNGTKSLTNGDSLNGSKKVKSTTKLNGKADSKTDGKTDSKTEGKMTKVRKKDKPDSSDEKRVRKKKKKDDKDGIKKEKDIKEKDKESKEKDSKDKDGKKTKQQPRTPHLTKSKVKVNGQTNGQVKKRKYVKKKALQRRSELLRRNLYKFRQYLRIKKEELLNLDRDELSALSQMTKDLMHCFIDTQNFEIDFDIYDPLMVSGLMSTQPFRTSPSQSILSSELLKGILQSLQSRAEPKSNGYDFDDDSSTEEEEPTDDECWTSAPSSPI